jgi:hypothetical protein
MVSSMKIFLSTLKDRELFLTLFLIVAANTAFITALQAELLPESLYHKGRFLLLGAVLVAVVFAFRKWEGIVGLMRPMTIWRINPLWFALALLWPPAMCIVTLLLKGSVNGDLFGLIAVDFATVTQPAVFVIVALGAFIGEIVWVSYAIGRLQKTTGTFLASQIVGVFWTLWWVPIVIINIGVIPNLPLDALLVNMLGVAAMCGFIYAHTKSGIAVLTLQLSLNNSVLIFPVAPDSGGVATYWLFAVVYSVAVFILYVASGLGIRPPDVKRSQD